MSYIPHTDADRKRMLNSIGVDDISDLFEQVPSPLKYEGSLDIPGPFSEMELQRYISDLASLNTDTNSRISFLGGGVYDHYIPATVSAITGRSEFYTSYTPYQPEISQGNLQSIFEFQSLVCRLTGMDVANASMYDGASALAEAALMATNITGRKTWVISDTINPNYKEVLKTYGWASGINIVEILRNGLVADNQKMLEAVTEDTACVIIQHPNFFGYLESLEGLCNVIHNSGALLILCVDPMSLGIMQPPGHYGADICVAEGQSLGIPQCYGGPLLGLFACKKEYVRQMPGRLVGKTTDSQGREGYTLTLQTREQHIRRERATSNICTNQALYALAATVYMSTLGKSGFRGIAELCFQKAHYAARRLQDINGYEMVSASSFFKEFVIKCSHPVGYINKKLYERGIIGGLDLGNYYPDLSNHMLLCVTEKRTIEEIDALVEGMTT